MLALLDGISQRYGIQTETLLILGICVGVTLIFLGVASLVTERNPAAVRLAATASSRREARRDRGLLRPSADDPKGLMKSFMGDKDERTTLQWQLSQAGFPGKNAMRNFILIRIFLGLVLPTAFVVLIFVCRLPGSPLPTEVVERVSRLSNLRIIQLLAILVAAGFFGPAGWLRGRVTERQRRVEESFPNALDLMQISLEAGLGFDAAMTRVGNELATVSPDISYEFLTVQRQVQAGRARDVAMQDMARRTGVEVIRSFAGVVHQSMQFGTSMSEALTTYAKEMRLYREMRAQEMANKLPVKMSAVLASLMLPALIMLTVGPVVIRYIRMFS